MMVTFRKAEKSDLDSIAAIYKSRFPSERRYRDWVHCCNNAYPAKVYYVAMEGQTVIAYILWGFKNGFRDQSIIELEQIAVDVGFSGKGIGKKLIQESYELFLRHVYELGFGIGAVYVTTSEGNFAERLYKLILGVDKVALIEGYGSGNEVVLYKRN